MWRENGRPGVHPPGLRWLRERARVDAGARAASDAEQTLGDQDQTLADSDQTSSDEDRAAAETEQRLSDQDQHAADRDQAAADRERASELDGGHAHEAQERSRADRLATARERGVTTAARAQTG